MSTKQVFISYAWGGQSEDVANELEALLSKHQIDLVRDKSDLGFKGLIQEFMREIGQGKFVVLVISDKYLKSKNCMFELLEVEKKGEFYERVFPIILPDAAIYDSLGMIDYLKYWDQKIKELNTKVKELENLADTRKIQDDINLYTDIRGAIIDLAAKLGNMNTLSLELMRSKNYEPLLEALKAKISPPVPDQPKKKEGKVLYHIPGMMQVDTWTRCMVRLAWDEILLQENLAIPEEERMIESIRLGQIMQVSLMQGEGEENFDIQSLNNEEQFIAEDDYTEWQFKVKPRKPGKFSLILRISLIQIIEGKERKKDLVLEREVTAEAVVPQALPKFETAASGLDLGEQKPIVPVPPSIGSPAPASFQRTSFLKKSIPYAASISVILVAIILIFQSNNSMDNSPIAQAPDGSIWEEATSEGSSEEWVLEEPIPTESRTPSFSGEKVLIAMSLDTSELSGSPNSSVLVFSMEMDEFLILKDEIPQGVTLYSLEKEDTVALNLGRVKTLSHQEVKDSVLVIQRKPSDSRPVNPELQKLKSRPVISNQISPD